MAEKPNPTPTVAVGVRMPLEEWRAMQTAMQRAGYHNQAKWLRDLLKRESETPHHFPAVGEEA